MNSVLRIALAYFTIVPMQRWMNGAGLLLLAYGAIQFTSADLGSGRTGFEFAMVGVGLLTLMPALGGGCALRFASTRTLLHVLPYGRVRALLGSMLTITLVAALVTLPFLAMEWFMARHGARPSPGHVPPLQMFLVSWPFFAAAWALIFAVSRSTLVWAVIGLMPVVVMSAGSALGPNFPGTWWVFVAGLACWAAFAAWYLRTASVTRPDFPLMSGGSDPSVTPLGSLLVQVGATSGPVSRFQGQLQYLFGCASPLFFVLNGAWIAAIVVVLQLFTAGSLFERTDQLLHFLNIVAFISCAIGYNAPRRARLLWLRANLDRRGLFRLVEKQGLRYSMTAWLCAGTLLMICALIDRPELAPTLLLYFALQATVAVALFYGGLALTERWSARDVALGVGLGLLMMVQVVVSQPRGGPSSKALTWALIAAVGISLALRGYAARRWRTLDWRVAKLSRATMRLRT
jgi:hypothetical protein